MTYVAMAPNNSSNDCSRMERNDMEEEHQEEEIAEELDSDATVTKDLGKDSGKNLIKIVELQKNEKQLMAQYNRVLKQWDNNTCEHAPCPCAQEQEMSQD
jgi:hypothetical protein